MSLWQSANVRVIGRGKTFRPRLNLPPDSLFSVDDAGAVVAYDSWHSWRAAEDFTDIRVPGRTCWVECAFPFKTADSLGALKGWRALGRDPKFGAFVASWRIVPGRPLPDNAQTALRSVGWEGLDLSFAPGGFLCFAELVGEASEGSEPVPAAACYGWFAWVVDAAGRPLDPFPDREGIGFAPCAMFEEARASANLGPGGEEALWRTVELMGATVLMAFQMLNSGVVRTSRRTWYGSRGLDEYARRHVADEEHVAASVDLAALPLPQGQREELLSALSAGRATDLERVADDLGVPYWISSIMSWARRVVRVSPEEREAEAEARERAIAVREAVIRAAVLAEEQRAIAAAEAAAMAAEEARRAEVVRARKDRLEARRALRARSEADRAAWFARLEADRAASESGRRRAVAARPEPRRTPGPSRMLPAVLEPAKPVVDRTRPGPDYRWDDEADLVRQGSEWRVTTAEVGGRSPAADFMDELGATAPQDLAAMLRTIERLADAPDGSLPNERTFRCFKPHGYDFLLCEVKRHAGVAGHSRLFAVRVRSTTADGVAERRFVLLNGFSKKTNEAPQAEIDRAARIRDRWIADRVEKDVARGAVTSV